MLWSAAAFFFPRQREQQHRPGSAQNRRQRRRTLDGNRSYCAIKRKCKRRSTSTSSLPFIFSRDCAIAALWGGEGGITTNGFFLCARTCYCGHNQRRL